MVDRAEVAAALELEKRVGHPGDKWDALAERVQAHAIARFTLVQDDWLDLMWTLDAYRRANVPPREMPGPPDPGKRIAAIYRGKGHWFAKLVSLLLANQTTQQLASRSRVQGFSQEHQIDVAWPDRGVDPLVCTETKVTGGPPYGSTPARAAMGDWATRRKELKFAATDLKLYRRGLDTNIEHWDVWRQQQPPKMYFLWAARLGPTDKIEKMVDQVQELVNTYLDGAGVFGWGEDASGTCYEAVSLPASARVSGVDDLLHRIASDIRKLAGPDEQPPQPVGPGD